MAALVGLTASKMNPQMEMDIYFHSVSICSYWPWNWRHVEKHCKLVRRIVISSIIRPPGGPPVDPSLKHGSVRVTYRLRSYGSNELKRLESRPMQPGISDLGEFFRLFFAWVFLVDYTKNVPFCGWQNTAVHETGAQIFDLPVRVDT